MTLQTPRSGIARRIASCFLAGLLVVLPAALTIGIIVWVAGFVRQVVGPGTLIGNALRSVGLHFVTNEAGAYVLGLLFVLAAIFGLGLLAELGAKRFLQRRLDAIAKRIPLVGGIYGTSKQLVAMFDQKNESEMKSMEVVWCFFGQEGGAGLLALMPTPEKLRIGDRDYRVVIVPTAPVPFGGALVFMPVELVKAANMSVDELMSIYVSMGITTPQFIGTSNPPIDASRPVL